MRWRAADEMLAPPPPAERGADLEITIAGMQNRGPAHGSGNQRFLPEAGRPAAAAGLAAVSSGMVAAP